MTKKCLPNDLLVNISLIGLRESVKEANFNRSLQGGCGGLSLSLNLLVRTLKDALVCVGHRMTSISVSSQYD